MRNLIFAVALLGMVASARPALADTTVAGGNVINQTWTAAGSPYIVAGDISVPSGAFLTIQPGVEVRFANTDGQAAGDDTSRIELRVAGTLTVNGTTGSPVTFRAQTGSQTGVWYGISVLSTAASVSVTGAVIKNAGYGIRSAAAGSVLSVSNTSLLTDGYGIYLTAGTPTLSDITATGGSYGIYVTGASGPSITRLLASSNSSAAVQAANTGGSSVWITNSTLYGNFDGVRFGGDATSSLNLKNSLVTNNSNYGIRRDSGLLLAVSYTDAWGNGVNISNAPSGVGVFSSNPLYVSSSNLRLTSNSPARFAGDTGGDAGVLPYVSDATPGLYGVLWTDTALPAGNYGLAGDLDIAEDVTLTVQPGATLEFATTDIMGSGADAAHGELRVAGTLNANGTAANPINFNSSGSGASSWIGIRVFATGTATLSRATISEAAAGLDLASALSPLTFDHLTVHTSGIGINVSAGAVGIDASTLYSNSYGVYVTGAANVALTNLVARSQSSAGVQVQGTGATLSLTNATLNANFDGVRLGGDAQTTGTIKPIITNNSNYGVRRDSGGTLAVSYSDAWGNGVNVSNASVSNGMSQNPNFAGAPTNLALLSSSVCIDAGTGSGAPNHDIDNVTRPLDGDGINGAAHDMGAYEFVLSPVCGDSIVSGSESCDEGVANGTYGHCLADCSGPGPHCGDGSTNGPETCDDMNSVNSDGCLNSCVLATCGDGVIRSGVETCDDGNNVATDACTNACQPATCGDGVVRAGVEACDDGNQVNTDACLDGCIPASCGDGYVQAGVEACDDGNSNENDGCTSACTGASCGDGIQQSGEACDDGNGSNTDGCLTTCVAASCGDGFVRVGVEACDDGNRVATDACTNACQNAACGDGIVQSGAETCDDANGTNGDACTNACQNATCGDGIVQSGVEGCDDGNESDTDSCLAGCIPARCGDGIVRTGVEACDDGNQVNGDDCTNDCTTANCGNGAVESGEDCDDGNGSNTDGCLNTCIQASCGDSFVRAGVEACDDGNGVDGDACTNACRSATCGDGIVRLGVEECDDGNSVPGDACSNSCTAAVCGDGIVALGDEPCDDGNASNTDACLVGCLGARCGDGFVRAGVEACDDGNNTDGDDCEGDCALVSCGDGAVQEPEICDDGNASNSDACLSTCLAASCGDGFVRAGREACDDGNDDDHDGCTNACRRASCGDGVVQLGVEECDDGNGASGDGCNPNCELEATGAAGGTGEGGEAGAPNGPAGGGEGGEPATPNGAGGSGEGGESGATSETGGNHSGGSSGRGGASAYGGASGEAGSPPSSGPPGNSSDDSGCGCRTAPSSSGPTRFASLLSLALLLTLRRRRRRTTVAFEFGDDLTPGSDR